MKGRVTWIEGATAAMLLVALKSPAGADAIAKFYNGTTGYAGPFNGAGTVYDATKGSAINCPDSGPCGSDNVASSLVYTALGITATASPTSVWGDFAPNFGGLGVGTGSPSDTDQIADFRYTPYPLLISSNVDGRWDAF